MRSLATAAAVVALVVPAHAQQSTADQLRADILAEWSSLDIGSWSVLVKQDPLTDKIDSVMARTDQDVLLMCDRFGDDAGGPELRMYAGNLPRLQVESVEVTYRIGRDTPQTGTWAASTGDEASSVIVPNAVLECALRAGRLVIRVGETTRVYQWQGGDDVFTILRGCAAP